MRPSVVQILVVLVILAVVAAVIAGVIIGTVKLVKYLKRGEADRRELIDELKKNRGA